MSDSQTVREWLTATVAPLLPLGWRWVPHQVTPATIDRTTVVLSQTAIRPLEEAPESHIAVDVTFTVISRYAEDSRAEVDLDDAVLELFLALDTAAPGALRVIDAAKAVTAQDQAAWDIRARVISKKKGH